MTGGTWFGFAGCVVEHGVMDDGVHMAWVDFGYRQSNSREPPERIVIDDLRRNMRRVPMGLLAEINDDAEIAATKLLYGI